MREHAVERARYAAQIKRLDQGRRQSDLPVGQEAAELFLGTPFAMRELLHSYDWSAAEHRTLSKLDLPVAGVWGCLDHMMRSDAMNAYSSLIPGHDSDSGRGFRRGRTRLQPHRSAAALP